MDPVDSGILGAIKDVGFPIVAAAVIGYVHVKKIASIDRSLVRIAALLRITLDGEETSKGDKS